jgi:hypothetical protein
MRASFTAIHTQIFEFTRRQYTFNSLLWHLRRFFMTTRPEWKYSVLTLFLISRHYVSNYNHLIMQKKIVQLAPVIKRLESGDKQNYKQFICMIAHYYKSLVHNDTMQKKIDELEEKTKHQAHDLWRLFYLALFNNAQNKKLINKYIKSHNMLNKWGDFTLDIMLHHKHDKINSYLRCFDENDFIELLYFTHAFYAQRFIHSCEYDDYISYYKISIKAFEMLSVKLRNGKNNSILPLRRVIFNSLLISNGSNINDYLQFLLSRLKHYDVFIKYNLKNQIACGSYGSVYKFTQNKVIKVSYNLCDNPDALRIWLHEVEILKKLKDTKKSSNHIPEFYEATHVGFVGFIVLEDGGQNLGQYLKWISERNLRIAHCDIDNMIKSICSAIDFLHKQKIIHMDIKRSNILVLSRVLELKITDFGHSLEYNDESKTKIKAFYKNSNIRFRGTSGYKPPEVYDRNKVYPGNQIQNPYRDNDRYAVFRRALQFANHQFANELKDIHFSDGSSFSLLKKYDIFSLGVTMVKILCFFNVPLDNGVTMLKKLLCDVDNRLADANDAYNEYKKQIGHYRTSKESSQKKMTL